MPANGKGQIVNRTGLSDIFGVALNTVDSWVRAGCPYVQRGSGRGQEWQFNTAAVSKWLRERAATEAAGEERADAEELKRRKLAAEAEMAELELAKAKGEVGLVAEFERAEASRNAIIRQNVLNVPQRAVLQLLGETDEGTFKRKLRAELVLALEQSASADLALDPPDDGEDEGEASDGDE